SKRQSTPYQGLTTIQHLWINAEDLECIESCIKKNEQSLVAVKDESAVKNDEHKAIDKRKHKGKIDRVPYYQIVFKLFCSHVNITEFALDGVYSDYNLEIERYSEFKSEFNVWLGKILCANDVTLLILDESKIHEQIDALEWLLSRSISILWKTPEIQGKYKNAIQVARAISKKYQKMRPVVNETQAIWYRQLKKGQLFSRNK
ncbi:MAG: hypothetical protein KGM99_18230, partial [Burkholderiales bacterium]|nr:hypothetical protein [Burkholderiales bacterium]